MPDKNVTIKKSYLDTLKRSHAMFMALRECGVDNWEGYNEAMKLAFPSEDDGDDE